MKKPNKRDSLNLVFSAILIIGYIVCSYFFLTLFASNPAVAPYINALVFIVFGLVVFYATRVGENKAVRRFSLATLLILDIPALYIVLAQLIPSMPLHTQIANLGGLIPLTYSPLFILACIALGYGLPYTFFSGYEQNTVEESFEIVTGDETICGCCDGECSCCACGKFTVCDADTEGALLVVDDYDLEFNPEKEIKISDVTPCDEEVKIGSFVVYTEASAETDSATADESAEEPSEE